MPSRTQFATPGTTGATPALSVSASWPGATAVGALLIAFIAAKATAVGAPTFTPPAGVGWTAGTRHGTTGGANQDPSVQGFYIKNAASQSGSKTWSISATAGAVLFLAEYAGYDVTAPLDQDQGAETSTATTSQSAGSIAAAALLDELAVGIVAAKNLLRVFSAPTNSFTLVNQTATSDATASNGIAACYLERIGGNAAGAAISTSVTVTASSPASGILDAYKQTVAGIYVPRGLMVFQDPGGIF